MYRSRLVALSLLAGCDAVFGLGEPGADAALVDPDGGGDASDDGGSSTVCPPDEFTGALALAWSEFVGCTPEVCSVTTTGDQLVLTHDATGYVGVDRQVMDFTGHTMAIEAGAWNTITTGHEAYALLAASTGNSYQIALDANSGQPTVSFGTWTAGVAVAITTVPFDPARHRWWQIEHTGAGATAQVVFSTRGSTTEPWETQHVAAVTHSVTALFPEIGAGSYATAPPSSSTRTMFTFDNFTLCPAP